MLCRGDGFLPVLEQRKVDDRLIVFLLDEILDKDIKVICPFLTATHPPVDEPKVVNHVATAYDHDTFLPQRLKLL
jgi:hypothetical protein